MNDFLTTHPYQYEVSYTVAPGQPEQRMEMAFTSPQDAAGIQALKPEVTVTRVEVLGGAR